MHLRRPSVDELPEISALCMRSKAHWGYDDAFLRACRDELTFGPTSLADGEMWVLDVDDTIVGTVQVEVSDREGELLKLFIDPDSMGQGYGRVLFDWSVSVLRESGARTMVIEADPDAEPFYRRMGAVPAGTAPSGSIPGRMLPRLELRLKEAA